MNDNLKIVSVFWPVLVGVVSVVVYVVSGVLSARSNSKTLAELKMAVLAIEKNTDGLNRKIAKIDKYTAVIDQRQKQSMSDIAEIKEALKGFYELEKRVSALEIQYFKQQAQNNERPRA